MRRLSFVLLGASACGGGQPPGSESESESEAESEGEGRYLPLAVGASWTYDVTDLGTGDQSDKTQTVEDDEDVGDRHAGVTAFRVRTEKLDGTTVSWQEDTGSAIRRHHELTYDTSGVELAEEWYDPYKLRIDESADRTADGAVWTEDYVETHIEAGSETQTPRQNDWEVVAVAEEVEVPAGTFTCLRLHRVGAEVGQADKTYWFARGVGKVKETGGQEELLVEYSPPAAE